MSQRKNANTARRLGTPAPDTWAINSGRDLTVNACHAPTITRTPPAERRVSIRADDLDEILAYITGADPLAIVAEETIRRLIAALETVTEQAMTAPAPDDVDKTIAACLMRSWADRPDSLRRARELRAALDRAGYVVVPRAPGGTQGAHGPQGTPECPPDPADGARGESAPHPCDGADDPRHRCGRHHVTGIANAIGGYNCCCGWPWLHSEDRCADGAKTGDPVLLLAQVADLIAHVVNVCGAVEFEALAAAVTPFVRAQVLAQASPRELLAGLTQDAINAGTYGAPAPPADPECREEQP